MREIKEWAEGVWVRFLVAVIVGLLGVLLVALTFGVAGRGADLLRTLGSALVVAMIVAVTLGLLFEPHLLTKVRETRNNVITQRERTSDPVLQALEEAPEDDEDLSPGDQKALQEGHADLKAGRVVLHEEARRRLGS